MAYQPLTPIKEETKETGSLIPEAYIPLHQQPKEYMESLQTDINESVGNVRDFDMETGNVQESDIKDIWDNFYLGARNMLQTSKNYFLNTLPNIVFKNIREGDPAPFTGEPATKEYVKTINERNEKLRNWFKDAYNKSEEKYEEWLAKNPQLQPPKYREEWNKPALDAIKANPKLLADPAYIAYKAAGSASFTLGVLGTTLAVGATTGNPVLALGAGVAVATPMISQDLFEDLIVNGATEEQAADLTKYIAPIIASVEVAGDLPLIKQLGGKIFSKALTTNIRKEVVKKTMAYVLKKGFKTIAQIEIAETMEEVLQAAIQDATVRTVNKNRKILGDAANLITETLIATLPFALVGGTSAVQQEIKLAKAQPKTEMKMEEPSVKEIAIEGKPEVVEEPEVTPIKKDIRKLTKEAIHNIVAKIIPEDTADIKVDLIKESFVTELLNRNVSERQAGVAADNVVPGAVAVFTEGIGTEAERLKGFAETLENELLVKIPEIKPEVKAIIPKELESLATDAKKFKTVEEFVSSTIFETSLSGIETKALSKFEGEIVSDQLIDFYNQITKEIGKKPEVEKPKIEKKPKVIEDVEVPKAKEVKANKDWEENYAKEYGKLESRSMDITQQIKKAKKAEREVLQKKLDKITERQVEMEEEWISKWSDKVEEKPKKKVSPEEVVQARKKITKAITTLETDLSKQYTTQEKAQEEIINIWVEMDVAEAGKRVPVIDKEGEIVSWLGEPSKFPKWIPADLRHKKLLNKVMDGFKDINNIKYPTGIRSAQRELFNTILEELDSRLGIDTSQTRNSILDNYDKKYKKEVTEQLSESTKGGEELAEIAQSSTGEEEISVEDIFGKAEPEVVEVEGIGEVPIVGEIESKTGKITFFEKPVQVEAKAPTPSEEILKTRPVFGEEKSIKKRDRLVALESELLKKKVKPKPTLPGQKGFYLPPKEFDQTNLFKQIEKGAPGAAEGMFRENVPVELGNVDKIRPIKFVEMVSIARELSGKFPEVKKLRKYKGFQQGKRLVLNRNLFEKGNHKQLAATLAHEIGHLVDFLPDLTSSRGNLLSRLLTMRKFLKNTFGTTEITNKELREELWELSKWWRPFDEGTSTLSHTKYRKSSSELYADAISVLFNTPGTLERMAPNFYKEFFEHLDNKPEVRKAFFDLQEILAEGEDVVMSKREKAIRNMFKKGEDLYKIKEAERESRQRSIWFKLKYELIDQNQAVIDLIEKTKKEGKQINDDENPIYYLEERNYLGGEIKNFIETKIDPIYKELNKNELSWEDFGVVMFLNRVMTERGDLANPLGHTPESAKKQLEDMRKKMGNEAFEIIDSNVIKFRDAIKGILQEGYNAGLYKPELYQKMINNPAYATFQVLDHLQENIPASIKRQIGTLKEISNPATATLIKTVSTIRSIERNKVINKTKGFLEKYHSDEIKPAKKVFTGKTHLPVESKESNEKLVIYMDQGNVEGIYVDPYIEKSLRRNTTAYNNGIIEVLRMMNGKVFRPLFITFNLGFQAFNLARDFVRTWKNVPDMTLFNLVKLYGESYKHAKARAFGISDELISEMEKSRMLGITYNDLIKGRSSIDDKIDKMMLQYGVLKPKPSSKNPAMRFLLPILDFIERTGNLVETLPKVAGYKQLNGKLPPKEFAKFIRTRVGSPDFLRRGAGYGWYNEVFLFSNAIKEGMRADYVSAIGDPKTRSGFWWKTAKITFLPKVLMFAALLGLLGDDLKEMMEDASEYDKTNYIIIPLGKDANGKTIYFRVPQDETGRFLGGLLWKGLNLPRNGVHPKDFAQILSYTGGQLPSVTPVIDAAFSISQFLAGQNPYDFFRGRNVLKDDEFKAGGKYALIPFLKWQFQQLGGGTFMRFEIHEQTPTEKSLLQVGLNAPLVNNIIGRFIKVSDYGVSERARDVTDIIEQERAANRIEETRVINKYIEKFQKAGSNQKDIQPMMNEATKEAFKGQIKTKGEVRYFQKKFKVAILRGQSDSRINSLIYATSVDSQIALLVEYKKNMNKEDFNDLFGFIQEQNIISSNTARKFFESAK